MSIEKQKQSHGMLDSEKKIRGEMLTAVLEITGDDEKMINLAIGKVLRNQVGERKSHLWRELSQKAKDRIRQARKSVAV